MTSSASRPISNYSSVAQEEVTTEPVVRGNWRRDMAKYEDNLTTTRKQEAKISSPTAPVTSSLTTSWSRPTIAASPATTKTSYSSTTTSSELTTETSSSSWRDKFKKYGSDNTETAKPDTVSKPVEMPNPSSVSKPVETPKPTPKPAP